MRRHRNVSSTTAIPPRCTLLVGLCLCLRHATKAFVPQVPLIASTSQLQHIYQDSSHSLKRRHIKVICSAGRGRTTTPAPLPQGRVTPGDISQAQANETTSGSGVGVAKALARQGESRAAELRQAKAQERVKAPGKANFINPIDIPIKAGRAARRALERLGEAEEPKPQDKADYQLYFDKKFLYAVPTPTEKPPTVLVIGATGEIGRQVVKKLLFKAYRVQVLVRNLYSSTLNLLGTGVSYVKGDLSDLSSLLTACDGVDKVIFVAQARNDADAKAVQSAGLRNLAQAFQETRINEESGKRITTKRTLFKFRKAADKDVFSVVKPQGQQESATASWEVEDIKAGRPTFKGSLPAEGSTVYLESKKIGLNLDKFGGFVMFYKAQAEPQIAFRFVLRGSSYVSTGVQYEFPLPPVRNRYVAARVNFRDFVPMKNGKPYSGVVPMPLNPSDVQQFGFAAVRTAAAPGGIESESGKLDFSLTLEGVKVFRARQEPEIVVLSSSEITPETAYLSLSALENGQLWQPVERLNYYQAQGEQTLKNSGLAYTIVRISDFTSMPTEGRPLSVSKDGNNLGMISRPDTAEVLINCLFNANVCNSELYASENPRFGDRDIPRLLSDLRQLPF